MDSFPVKLHLPKWPVSFTVTPHTHCIFKVIIPLGVPRLIDTSLPAPPYIGIDATYNGIQILVRPTVRAILSGLLRELLGNDYPVCSVLGSDPDDDISQSHRLSEGWDSKFIMSEADLDLKAGKWKDQFGQEGQGQIDAYVKNIDGHISLMFGFNYLLIQGPIPEGDEDLRVIQFTAEPTLSDGKVVFNTREYTERGRQGINSTVKHDFKTCKAREDAGLPIVFSLL